MPEPITIHEPARDHLVDDAALMAALAAPFAETEIKFKPQVVKGTRALTLAYVDVRAIQDRLDAVLGTRNWQDDYECLPDGSVLCRLKIRVGGEWLTKVDVGGPSEQPDGGDRVKAAFSDALKRAAVKFGIGRYLYRLPQFWCDYDPQTKKILKPPRLPVGALPPSRGIADSPDQSAIRNPQSAIRTPPAPEPAAKKPPANLPANGAELQRRLSDYDSRLARQGLCQPGDLVKHVVQAGVQAGHDADLAAWSGDAILLAVAQTRAFEARRRQGRGPQKEVA
jgi:hypothetical protein